MANRAIEIKVQVNRKFDIFKLYSSHKLKVKDKKLKILREIFILCKNSNSNLVYCYI